MEFGFGFLVLFFVIFFGVGRMCGWGRRCRRDDQGERLLLRWAFMEIECPKISLLF